MVLTMDVIPHMQVTERFVSRLVQDKEAQLGVSWHVFFNELGVVRDIPAIGHGSWNVLIELDLATRQHAGVPGKYFVLHDCDMSTLDAIWYGHSHGFLLLI